MHFSEIELYNFGIYKGKHNIELIDQRKKKNITLVGGMNMTDIRIDRPEEHKTQTKKYYKSKYCVSLHLPKELEEKVKDAAESEARNVTSYITSLILKDLKEKKLEK